MLKVWKMYVGDIGDGVFKALNAMYVKDILWV